MRWELNMPETDIQTAETFSTIFEYVTADRPKPPYSGDIVAPKSPNSAILSAII